MRNFWIESQAGLSVTLMGMITAALATAQRAMMRLEIVIGAVRNRGAVVVEINAESTSMQKGSYCFAR